MKGYILAPVPSPGTEKLRSDFQRKNQLAVVAYLDLGFRKMSYLSQVLTGANVRVGPSCKYPFQLQQLPNTEGGPLSPIGTQTAGTACGSG